MSPDVLVTSVLILAGAVTMLVAILKRHVTLRMFEGRDSTGRIEFALMVFFFFGYIVAAGLALANRLDLLAVSAGVVFFGGALFVYLVTHHSHLALHGLNAKVSDVADANVHAAQLMVELEEANQHLESTTKALQVAKEEAEEADRVKGAFLASISHELRTPLNGILGYSQVLKGDTAVMELEQARYGIDVIERSGRHLLDLINDILDLSKIEAGKMELDPSPVLLAETVGGIGEMVGVNAASKGVELTVDLDDDAPECIGADRKRLQQVLLNLLNNAVKFTSEGSVELAVRRLAGSPGGVPEGCVRLRFEVSDTGRGIAAEHLERIFVPFEQVKTAGKGAEGTGLGLAISSRLVSMMGGELRARSEVDVGSKFWFDLTLPVASREAVAQESRDHEDVTGYEGESRRVLVVDDVAANRAVLVSLLVPLGFEVAEAKDGAEAIERARELEPDLVLMDLVMPNVDGFAATREIRAGRDEDGVRVVAVSASAASAAGDVLGGGLFDDFILKPVDVGRLLRTIEEQLGLEWTRRRPREATAVPPPADVPSELLAPSGAELEGLRGLAEDGDFVALQSRLAELERLEPRHAAFCERLRALTRSYEDEEICRFISSLQQAAR